MAEHGKSNSRGKAERNGPKAEGISTELWVSWGSTWVVDLTLIAITYNARQDAWS
jgi:hypothetical protein